MNMILLISLARPAALKHSENESFFLQSLSFLNRRSQRQQTSADRQNTEVYFEYFLGRWMHIIRRITAVKTYHPKGCSVSLGVLCGLNFVSFVSFVVKLPKMLQKCHKSKTNPKRTQTNPIFWRSNPILSEILGIFDKFRTTFLCKTNPMVCYRYSNRSGV